MKKRRIAVFFCCAAAALFMLAGCGEDKLKESPYIIASPLASVLTSLAPAVPTVPPPNSPVPTLSQEIEKAAMVSMLKMLDGVGDAAVASYGGQYIAAVVPDGEVETAQVLSYVKSALTAQLPKEAEIAVTADAALFEQVETLSALGDKLEQEEFDKVLQKIQGK